MSGAPAAPTSPSPAAERRKGYGRWSGERSAQAWRWWVIAQGNLLLAWNNKWVKALLVASLIPGVIASGITYFFLPLSAAVLAGIMSVTLVFTFLISALVGARLISEDRRQGAFLAHFARPVTRRDYIVGKFVAMVIPLLFVTMASPMFAIIADAAVPSETVVDRLRDQGVDPSSLPDEQGLLVQAGHLPAVGAVLWFGIIMSSATSGIVLGLSSLSTRARIAGLIWFAVVAFGAAAHGILGEALETDWPALLSWMDTGVDLSSFLVGFEDNADLGRNLEYDLFTRTAILGLLGAGGIALVWWQLDRAEAGAR